MGLLQSAPSRFLSIHYLRAVAAVMVVIYHVYSNGLVIIDDHKLVSWLKQGVAIFFVISGFVITSSADKENVNPLNFIFKRIKRILPLYWVATALSFPILVSHDMWGILRSLAFLPNIDNTTGQVTKPALDVGWTLNFEMAFYAAFAAAMMLPKRFTFWTLTAVMVSLPLLARAPGASPIFDYYAGMLLLDFVSGMLIARLRLITPAWGIAVGFGMLAVLPQYTDLRLIAVTLPAALIVTSSRSLDGKLQDWALPSLIGEASYAIYLFHLLALQLMFEMFGAVGSHWYALLVTCFAVAFGLLAHLYLEKPLTLLIGRAERYFASLAGRRIARRALSAG